MGVCQRLWHFKSIMRIEEPSGPAQELGSRVHKFAEKILEEGASDEDLPDTKEAKIALAGAVSYAPYMNADKFVEKKFLLPTYEGGPEWVGYIDLLVYWAKPKHDDCAMNQKLARACPDCFLSGQIKVVGDHKTTSDFRYHKTPAELLRDPQMISYARWAVDQWPNDEGFCLKHFNLRTRTPYKVLEVEAFASKEHILEQWNGPILGAVKAMQAASEAKSALELEPNRESCHRFGKPCHFSKQCKVSGFAGMSLVKIRDPRLVGAEVEPEELKSLASMEMKDMETVEPPKKLSLSEKMKQKEAEAAAAKGAAPKEDDGAAAAKAKAVADEAQKKFQAEVAASNKKPDVTRVEASSKSPEQLALNAALDKKAETGFIPPDAPPRDAGKSSGAPPAAAVETKAEEPAAPAKKKRGPNKKKEEALDNDAAEDPFVDTDAGIHLFVDCMPVSGKFKGQGVLLETWLSPLLSALAETHNLDDIRVAEEGPAAFGKWKALLTNLVRFHAKEAPGVLIVSSFAFGAHEALDALIPLAASVTRSLR